MPVFTCSDSTSSTQIVVLSEPVPVVVGTATSGSSGWVGACALPTGRVDVVHQLARVGGQQVDRLGGVDRGAAADREDRVERPGVAGELDRLVQRLVGRLDVHAVVRRDARARAPATCSAIRAGCPVAATPGSVTSSTRRAPSRARSWPISAAAPGPNLSAGAAYVKTVSLIRPP